MKRGTLDRQRQALTRGHTLRSRFPEEQRNARAGVRVHPRTVNREWGCVWRGG